MSSIEALHKMPTNMLIVELHNKGVTIEEIFGIYYQLEAMGSARDEAIFGNDEEGQHGAILTVGDARLAFPETKPMERKPF